MKHNTYNIFFGYSPLHKFILESENEIHETANFLIVPFETKFTRKKVHNFTKFSSNHLLLSKVYGLTILFISLIGKRCNVLITCNEHSPISILIKILCDPKEIWVCDEGNIEINHHKEINLTKYKIKFLLKFIISLGVIKRRYKDNKISRIYTLYPNFIKKIIKDKNVRIIKLQKNIRNPKSEISLNHENILIITSPLTENGNAKYEGQEIDILSGLFEQNPKKIFTIKPHYREKYEFKYLKLIKQYDNVNMIDAEYVSLPIQELPVLWGEVIGFHSTALDYFLCLGGIRISTLSGIVDSQHSNAVLQSIDSRVKIIGYDCKIQD